jgi:hypothetical protein
MKKFGNVGKVFGLAAVAVFVFAIGGCEQSPEAVIVPSKKTSPEVWNTKALKAALERNDITNITIPVSLNTNHEITVTSDKVITIPAGVVVTVKSLTAEANVMVIGPAVSWMTANRVALASGEQGDGEPDNGEAGVIRIKKAFEVKTDAKFDLTGNVKLAFSTTVLPGNAVVDGTLTAENEDSIFWIAISEMQVEITRAFTGNGTVQTSAGALPVVAGETVISEQYSAILSTPDLYEDDEESYVEGEEEDIEEEEEIGEEEDYTPVKFDSVTIKHETETVAEMTLEIEGEARLTATPSPEPEAGTAYTVRWSTTDKNVATVDAEGTVTAVGGGTANIFAQAGGARASCEVTVTAVGGGTVPGLYWVTQEKTDTVEEAIQAVEGFTTSGDSLLTAAFTAINADATNTSSHYLIVLGVNEENAPGYGIGAGITSISANTGNKANVKITLRGSVKYTDDYETNITIQKSSTAGALFTVYGNAANDMPELILEDITLKGISGNNDALVVAGYGTNAKIGNLTMNSGSRITGNTISTNSAKGGGVHIASYSKFTMNGGMIDNNKKTYSGNNAANGAGVIVANFGIFTMTGGSIENNIAGTSAVAGTVYGGGVNSSGTFTMSGGTIKGNTCVAASDKNTSGGGVYVKAGTFTMSGTAVIERNEAKTGSGVSVEGTFLMQGGEIKGNNASADSGAVNVYGTFTKTGGIIYGKNESAGLANTVTATDGHAIKTSSNKWRDSTAGSDMNTDNPGFWEG